MMLVSLGNTFGREMTVDAVGERIQRLLDVRLKEV